MVAFDVSETWNLFLETVKSRCSKAAFGNWIAPIKAINGNSESVTLEVPNVFVQEYLLSNYKKELCAFFPVTNDGEPAIHFVYSSNTEEQKKPSQPQKQTVSSQGYVNKLNQNYRFDSFIEGPTNQFVKSVAIGVGMRPGLSYNPFFIHGGVGLGKTHILHSIGHHIREYHPKLRVQCITTEEFINTLVDHLRNKSVDKMKQFYRSEVDVLLVDDIQFLQNKPNFEEEFSNTFETLKNQGKQIVITSDKPPAQLKLSERMTARMEWGLVAHIGVPELETRVAILQNKAKLRGFDIDNEVAFFIAEHLYSNVRQLEGAINRLSAHCTLMNLKLTQEIVERILAEILYKAPGHRITVDQILKGVAAVFQVRVNDLKGTVRTKDIVIPRQIAMYLACKFLQDSLQMIGVAFGKTHSTLLHACKAVEQKIAQDETLRRQIDMVERNLAIN